MTASNEPRPAEMVIPPEAQESHFRCGCGCDRKGYDAEGVRAIVIAELEELADGLCCGGVLWQRAAELRGEQ